ncbi:hypothetical protein [Effusibacillus lacus]|uniref:Uncharacterized protein n=1 Tax=Effusibacillus lacus TaxID=1348429 RepID=A0A292YNF4_9BACL|nr:hypothetical protein [Effusibacillus lacus]TCS76537.1 hypothetical protein EDD64_10282 [Effusibacillus lacus]GAX90441.1 hypothetical protein EFBL_2068 [Effusibacillus lacus]
MTTSKEQIIKTQPIGPNPKDWVKAAINLNAQVVGVRRDGHLDVVEVAATKEFSMDSIEYVHTGSRIPDKKRVSVGGDVRVKVWNNNQARIVKRLRDDDKVVSMYHYHSGGKDYFVVVTNDDEPETTFYFADIYWDLFEENPNYSFEIRPLFVDYFSPSRLPEGAVEC